jgi:phospholipid/cholesterol/gamma-HCH transport system permease protein
MIAALGQSTLRIIGELGDLAGFAARGYASALGSRRLGRRVVRAAYEQGVKCLPVVLIVGLFTGLVLGLQGYYVLNRYGSNSLLGNLVSLALVREMAPVLAALMIVGQAGSALTAELGIQRNSEQITALETMGIDPFGFLIAPRFIAAVLIYPMQTAGFALIGLVGGWLSACVLLGVEPSLYWAGAHAAIEPRHVAESLLKAGLFGAITILLCCHNGFNAHRRSRATGARAVSASTTRAVVFSCVAVLACDYLVTSFFV